MTFEDGGNIEDTGGATADTFGEKNDGGTLGENETEGVPAAVIGEKKAEDFEGIIGDCISDLFDDTNINLSNTTNIAREIKQINRIG